MNTLFLAQPMSREAHAYYVPSGVLRDRIAHSFTPLQNEAPQSSIKIVFSGESKKNKTRRGPEEKRRAERRTSPMRVQRKRFEVRLTVVVSRMFLRLVDCFVRKTELFGMKRKVWK